MGGGGSVWRDSDDVSLAVRGESGTRRCMTIRGPLAGEARVPVGVTQCESWACTVRR